MYQFGFIGMGNMGSAMLKGCLSVFPANTLAFSRKDAAKGEALSLETGAVWIDSNRTCAEQSRYIILAVKPQFYDGVLKEIQPVLDDSRIIRSTKEMDFKSSANGYNLLWRQGTLRTIQQIYAPSALAEVSEAK